MKGENTMAEKKIPYKINLSEEETPRAWYNVHKMYRPSPLVRAYSLEEALGTLAKIYYKYEGGNTSGSH
jgi:tryptophan synthase beta chain